MRKKLLLLLLALLALCACSAASPDMAAAAGRYPGRSIRAQDGAALAMDAVYPGSESYIELSENGRGTFCLGGEKTAIRWTLHGAELIMTAGGRSCRATLQDGRITTDYFGMDAELTFLKAGLTLPDEAEPAETARDEEAPAAEDPAEASAEDYWAGDWYGWYAVTDASDNLAEWIDQAWDVCGRIGIDGAGVYLALWDADCTPGERFCTAELRLTDGLTDAGSLTLKSGTILGCKLTRGDWLVDPADSDLAEYPHLICIRGSAADDKDPDTWFSYRIYLRPWGMDWDDVAAGDMSGCLYTDMMPPGYADWYLPLLRMGLTRAPDSFREAERLLGDTK